MKVVIVIALIGLVASNVTQAGSGADLQTFSADNIKNHHTYGLYFTDKDEGFLSTIGGLFSSDQEAQFKQMLVDTDQVSLLNINIREEELKGYADQMGITEFPYIVLYVNGDRDHNIHGPANEQTAIQILDELERVAPQPVQIQTADSQPVSFDATDVPGQTPEEHAAQGSPAAQVDVHNQPQGFATTRNPAGHETQPTQVDQIRVTPGLESSNGAVDIRPKQLGDWVHESPRHEPGYIEEIGQDDILPDNVWARQIQSAYPDAIAYDVWPEAHQIVIGDIAPSPAPVVVERAAPIIIEERPTVFAPPHVGAPHLAAARPEVIVAEPVIELSPWARPPLRK